MIVGAGGIGAEICRQIVRGGGRVFFTFAREAARAEALAGSLPSGSVAGGAQLDVADAAAVASVVAEAVKAMGRIDATINTAGYLHGLALFEEVDLAMVRRTIDVELLGVMNLAKVVLPHMRRQAYGRIVTVGSDSGKVGSKGEAASAAARGGVIAFSKALARETADIDICVNVVCPGPTSTALLDEMMGEEGLPGKLMGAMVRAIPKRRAGTPAEVASVAVFLASSAASYLTGQAISVSGGLTMC